MPAGKYRHYVTLQKLDPARSKDAYGAPTETWVDVGSLWAAVTPLTGREYFAAAQTQAELTHKVEHRYNSGVQPGPAMRYKYGSRYLYVDSVADVGERHREIEVRCIERVPTDGD